MADVNFYCPQCGGSLQAGGLSAGMRVQCPQCGNAVVVPQWASLPGSPQAASGRPTTVTVFGILSIVFGGLGLLCTPVSMIGTIASFDTLNLSSGYKVWLVVASGARVAGAVWLLIVGIGLLGLRQWSRSGAVAYAWFAIVLNILSMIGGIVALTSGAMSPSSEALPGYIGAILGGLFALIYPIVLLVFMTRPHVIEACDR